MKTLYVKSNNESSLKLILKNLFPYWNEVDLDIPTDGVLSGVYLGFYKGEFLANILVPEDYKNSELESLLCQPVTPNHLFS